MTRATTSRVWSAALLVLSACNWYEGNAVQDIAGPVPAGALVKFFNFGVSSPQVNFYADSRKMTAVSSIIANQEANTGVAYGGAGSGGLYISIPGGTYTLSGKIAAATDHDLAISNLSTALATGKKYSFYQSGIYNPTTKASDAFIVEDTFVPDIDYAVTYVRFVHAVSNANPLILYATKTAPPDSGVVFTVGAAVPYKGAGAFTSLAGGVYNLGVRYVDSTANKISRTGVSFISGRVYTIGARGDITVTSTTALDNTANR